ncbi:serine/threonine-protein kinase [Actinophytocola sp.]|uniref:serine/threonine-protein kinase n=1 Tax=Actinophytocola sp. TaxID=1872138 RepID=UPI002D80DFD5|nr:serine/threonine-protein kinase [Actinophytocola sp.]HET9140248.1 serine/threonine-protein kinase [Actinophytocola sp.]
MTTEDRVVAGRYRLGARIGSGAMGVVWQALDERLHRTVAVKQLLLHADLSLAQAEEARLRSMREGRIAARLSHPNAVTVYDVAEHEGEPWLVMEYLPSRSLATVLAEQGPLPPEQVARIGTSVASALIAAHAAGIVHREVKPANVLLGDDGTVKITDFGISRATGDVTVTATGMLAGTPAYLAPEVAKGHEPTAASDVFSLGSTLYTAVEGHSPFGLGENTLALLYAVAAGRVSPPRQAGPLTALLMSLLRPDPNDRPTMVAARDGLAAVAAGKPAMLAGRTDVIPPMRGSLPVGPPSPPLGTEATRLDAHPLTEPPPPARPANGRPPQHAIRPSSPRNVRSIVLTVVAIVVAALVGILVASFFTRNQPDPQSQSQQAPLSSSRAAPPSSTTASAAPTTTTATTTTSKPAGSSSAAAPNVPAALNPEAVIRQYFGLLPANPAAAWQLLTDQARGRYGTQDAYNQAWAQISAVEVLQSTAKGNQVGAVLKMTAKTGAQSTEVYAFSMAERDGRLLIDDFVAAGPGG